MRHRVHSELTPCSDAESCRDVHVEELPAPYVKHLRRHGFLGSKLAGSDGSSRVMSSVRCPDAEGWTRSLDAYLDE